jgi:hypothetical protein
MSVRSKLDSFDPKNVEDTLSDDGNIDGERPRKTIKV